MAAPRQGLRPLGLLCPWPGRSWRALSALPSLSAGKAEVCLQHTAEWCVGAPAAQLTRCCTAGEALVGGWGEPLTFSQNQSWGAECSTEQGTRQGQDLFRSPFNVSALACSLPLCWNLEDSGLFTGQEGQGIGLQGHGRALGGCSSPNYPLL